MSNVRKTPTAEVTASIVLLEDYPALAAAIASALKKFAPEHAAHAAHSLKELELLAGKLQPELLIIDVDPPWPKLTQLLGKLRADHPATRVLIIGATLPKEITHERGSQRALQFLAKPFDVPEFGAAIQALLGPWTDSETDKLRGTLRCFNVIDAVLLQYASARSVVLEVTKKSGAKSAELHFTDGQLRHAENGRHSGVDALAEVFSWKEPEVKEKKPGVPARRTIPTPWTEAFLTALRNVEVEDQEAPPHVAVPEEKDAAAKTGKSLVLIDDTDMLLLFVEDVLSTADPSLRITTAPTGAAGVKAVAEILPDLVLLDYSLPDFNGDEVCRRLLENERTAKISVLMMSGHVPEMNRTASEMENVVATIEKPFLSEALVARVRETLASPPARKRKKPSVTETVNQPTLQSVAPSAAPKPVTPPTSPAEPARTQRSPRTPEVPPLPPLPVAEPKADKRQSEPVIVPPIVVRPEVKTEPVSPSLSAVAPPTAPPAPLIPVAKPPPPPFVPFEHPVPHVIHVAEPTPILRPPIQSPAPARAAARTIASSATVPVLADKPSEIVLGLFLEVVSLQLTPSLRMGMLRARPSSLTVSLQVASPSLQAVLPPTGFQLGAVDLDRHGRIAVLRVKPTIQPFTPLATRNSFQIGGLALVPHNSHENLQLTPTQNAPMRMQLIADLETAGVELSDTFQISNIILKNRSNRVRVTLSEQAITSEKTGTVCEISAVQIDGGAHIVELTLSPI